MTPVSVPNTDTSLADWLVYLESIHAKSIDMGLARVGEVAARMDLSLSMVKIVVGGTNGKGSTCAMLEAILLAAGYKAGLYTSPHLINFNERARINGAVATDGQLTTHFARVEQARGATPLTYFEFTTLAVLSLFDASGIDIAVLEVGLGGRLDAVNIVDADCSIVTSVDIDHTDYLGDTRELIAIEKAHIFRPGKPAICSDPVPPASLLAYAADIGCDLWRFGKDFNYSGDRQQWAYGGRAQRRSALAYPALRGANQLLNASAALAALEALRDRIPVPQQAVRLGLSQAALPGRFQIIPGQPTVILDVAHNPHAASVLSQNLDNMGFHPYTYAVFGMLSDKDVAGVVAKFGQKIDHWFCADLTGPRALAGAALADRVSHALGTSKAADGSALCSHYGDPAQAFAQARERANDNDRILVFGSFLTVAAVLQALGRKA